MNILLAVDTASATFAVAIARDGEVLGAAAHPDPQDHSRSLLSTIDDVLRTAAVAPTALAVVVGPGSYAGLRVGIATIQGMALARALPVVSVGTLEAVAAAAGPAAQLAVHPAGRGDFAVVDVRDGRPVGDTRLVAGNRLASLPGLAGEGASAFGGMEVLPLDRCLAALRIAADRHAGDPSAIEAVYVREPSITRPRRTPLAAATHQE